MSLDVILKEHKKTGLNGYLYDFPIDYNLSFSNNIFNIHKYSIKKQEMIKNNV